MRYQRSKTFVLAAVLAAFASAASAQVIGKTMTVANMPACNSDKNFGLVTDATNATTLGAGGGSARVWVKCVSGTWTIQAVAAVADLAAYLPVSGTTAAPIVIQNSGAGNDLSLVAIDDVILTAADIVAGATTTIAFDAAGGTDELGIADASVSVGASIAFRIVGGTAPPVACAAPVKGTLYFDTDINKMCLCNGTNYVLMNDDSTTTGCS